MTRRLFAGRSTPDAKDDPVNARLIAERDGLVRRVEGLEKALADKHQSTARLDACIDSDSLLVRLFNVHGEPKTDLGREIQHYLDCGEWDVEQKRESLTRRLALLRLPRSRHRGRREP